MLRVHCVQRFYNLSDPGMEDLLYEVESVRRFAGLQRTRRTCRRRTRCCTACRCHLTGLV